MDLAQLYKARTFCLVQGTADLSQVTVSQSSVTVHPKPYCATESSCRLCAIDYSVAAQAGDAADSAGDQLQEVKDPKNVEQALDSVWDATESTAHTCRTS